MEQCEKGRWIKALSRSQIGSIQSLCEDTLAQNKDTEDLYAFLQKNLHERGAMHGAKFEDMNRFIKRVLEEETLPFAQTETEKVKLLCQVFDFSRKGKS